MLVVDNGSSDEPLLSPIQSSNSMELDHNNNTQQSSPSSGLSSNGIDFDHNQSLAQSGEGAIPTDNGPMAEVNGKPIS
jgi:hypothetical protein